MQFLHPSPAARAIAVVETAEIADHNIYHLDGPGAIKHLDMLLEIKKLDAIQLGIGAGDDKGILYWVPLIKHIQAKRKSVIAYMNYDEVESFLNEVSPEGICIGVSCDSEDKARSLVERIGKRFVRMI